MRLRNRFMLWFGLAALVPIAVAAMVTREVVARSYRDEYQRTRGAAERAARGEVERLETQLADTAAALARREDPLIGGLLQDLVKDNGELSGDAQRRLREQSGPGMAGRGIDVLTIVGAGDKILAAPHNRGTVGDRAPAARALAASARVVFRPEKIMGARAMQAVLVAETARVAKDGGHAVVVVVGRAIDARLTAGVRRAGQIDTRIVDGGGRELVAPAEPGWDQRAGTRVRIALPGDGAEVAAWIEVLVRDRDLARVENARDAIAGKPDGAIVVTTRRGDAGDRVELIVEDNGPGVAADLRDKVFAPYFTTKHGQGGTGLGLAIVHRIVSDHGGRIVIGPAAGGGARVAIELPLEIGQPLLASLVKRP